MAIIAVTKLRSQVTSNATSAGIADTAGPSAATSAATAGASFATSAVASHRASSAH